MAQYLDEKDVKNEPYSLVEEAYRNNTLALAKKGENLDEERKPIDTIISTTLKISRA